MDTQELCQLAAFGLNKMIEELQRKLADVNAMAAAPIIKHPRRGRPPKTLLLAAGLSAPVEGKLASGWPADPEERRAEMMRRRAKWAGKAKPIDKLIDKHPRNPNHPHHAAWLAQMRASQKKAWARMTVAQRKARIVKLQATLQQKQMEATA